MEKTKKTETRTYTQQKPQTSQDFEVIVKDGTKRLDDLTDQLKLYKESLTSNIATLDINTKENILTIKDFDKRFKNIDNAFKKTKETFKTKQFEIVITYNDIDDKTTLSKLDQTLTLDSTKRKPKKLKSFIMSFDFNLDVITKKEIFKTSEESFKLETKNSLKRLLTLEQKKEPPVLNDNTQEPEDDCKIELVLKYQKPKTVKTIKDLFDPKQKNKSTLFTSLLKRLLKVENRSTSEEVEEDDEIHIMIDGKEVVKKDQKLKITVNDKELTGEKDVPKIKKVKPKEYKLDEQIKRKLKAMGLVYMRQRTKGLRQAKMDFQKSLKIDKDSKLAQQKKKDILFKNFSDNATKRLEDMGILKKSDKKSFVKPKTASKLFKNILQKSAMQAFGLDEQLKKFLKQIIEEGKITTALNKTKDSNPIAKSKGNVEELQKSIEEQLAKYVNDSDFIAINDQLARFVNDNINAVAKPLTELILEDSIKLETRNKKIERYKKVIDDTDLQELEMEQEQKLPPQISQIKEKDISNKEISVDVDSKVKTIIDKNHPNISTELNLDNSKKQPSNKKSRHQINIEKRLRGRNNEVDNKPISTLQESATPLPKLSLEAPSQTMEPQQPEYTPQDDFATTLQTIMTENEEDWKHADQILEKYHKTMMEGITTLLQKLEKTGQVKTTKKGMNLGTLKKLFKSATAKS